MLARAEPPRRSAPFRWPRCCWSPRPPPPARLHISRHYAHVAGFDLPALRAAFACAAWIDALDPLFNKLSDAYMKLLIEDFGTERSRSPSSNLISYVPSRLLRNILPA